MDIHTACFQYCTSKAIRPSTIKSYENVVRTFVGNTGITELEQITLELLTEWKNDVVKRSSASTFNNYYRHLSALFNYCVKKKLLAVNPLTDVLKFTRVSSRGKTADLSDLKKVCSYLNSLAGTSPGAWMLLLLIQLLYYTGMRRAQACGLCWEDIDFERNTILLRREHSKNAREWTIPLDSRLKEPLKALKACTTNRLQEQYSDARQVFCMQLFDKRYAGKRFTPEQLTAALRRTAARSGTRLSPHMIRHLVATSLANHDRTDGLPPMSLIALKEMLGHSDIRTTALYIDADIEAQKRLLKGLDDLL